MAPPLKTGIHQDSEVFLKKVFHVRERMSEGNKMEWQLVGRRVVIGWKGFHGRVVIGWKGFNGREVVGWKGFHQMGPLAEREDVRGKIHSQ